MTFLLSVTQKLPNVKEGVGKKGGIDYKGRNRCLFCHFLKIIVHMHFILLFQSIFLTFTMKINSFAQLSFTFFKFASDNKYWEKHSNETGYMFFVSD